MSALAWGTRTIVSTIGDVIDGLLALTLLLLSLLLLLLRLRA